MKTLKSYYFLIDCITGMMLIYYPLYYKTILNFTGLQIGILYFYGGLIAIIGTLVNGLISEKFHSSKKIISITIFFSFIGTFILTTASSFKIILLLFTFIFWGRASLYALGDELTLSYIEKKAEENITVNFGKIRSFGSLGWGTNFLVNGLIFSVSPHSIFIIGRILTLILFIISLNLPHVKSKNKEMDIPIFKLKDIRILFKNKNYVLFILANAIAWATINNIQTYSQFFLQDLGGSITIYALLNFFILLIDFNVMQRSSKLNNLIGDKKYHHLTIALILMKYIIISFAFNPIFIYISLIFDPFFFGLYIPFVSQFVKKEFPNDFSKIAISLDSTISQFLGACFSLIFGYTYMVFGGNFIFTLMTILIIISYLFTKKINYKS